MHMRILKPLCLMAGVALSLSPVGAGASEEVGDFSKARSVAMKQMDSAVTNLSNQTYGLFPYNKQEALEKAQLIREQLDEIDDLFPKGSASASTKKEIWKKPTDFKKALKKVIQRADTLVATIETSDKHQVIGELKKLHKACNSCHAKFRK